MFHRTLIGMLATIVLLGTPALARQRPAPRLAAASGLECTFPLMTVGTWNADGIPETGVKDSELTLEFEDIIADEATARLASGYGTYDIIVRYADGYLHFIQSFLDGPLHITTVLEKETPDGRLKAMHSRHEFTDFALPGFTSSPEQYYGDCRIVE